MLGGIWQWLPVTLEATLAGVGIDDQAMARRQFLDALKQRVWGGCRGKRQVQRQRGLIQAWLERRVLEQRFDLGGKEQHMGCRCEVQRLDTDPVSRQQQLSTTAVPEREGEHTSQVVDAVDAELLVQVQDDLGIAA